MGQGNAVAGALSAIPSARVTAGAAAGLAVAAVLAAQLSMAAFLVAGAALLVVLGLAALRWPRALLVVVVLSPALVDLYAGQRLLPEDVQSVARFFSESLLVVLTAVLAWSAARRGTLVAAVRHPFSLAVAVFVGVSVVSALVNAVPPEVAAAGLIFTLDAALLFYLARLTGYDHDQARVTMWAVAVVILVTAVLAIGQALLSPDLLGIAPVGGRSGEGVRLGSLVRNPNTLGTLIGIVLPFVMYSLVRSEPGRRRWLIAGSALALTLALLLTYSRGSWLGVLIGFGGVALLIDRRALLAFAVILAVALGTAVIMPKGILAGGSIGFDPFATTVNRFSAVNEGRDLRTMFILNAVPIVEEHPLLGVGPGRYGGAAASIFGSPVYDRYGTDELLTHQETVDNFWLHIGVEGGSIGFAAFLAMVGTALLAPLRALRGAVGSRFSVPAGIVSATVVVCVTAVTTMLLEGNTVAFLFWFLLGIGSMSIGTGGLESAGTLRTGGPAGSATPSDR